MNETQIKKLRAHAGKLVANGESLSGVFEYFGSVGSSWFWLPFGRENKVPNFADGDEWRIAKPKKQLIDWSHPYFKGCATNYGEILDFERGKLPDFIATQQNLGANIANLRLATPADEDSNWQYFRSTPENDAKLRELAKMVRVEVRFAIETPEGMVELRVLSSESHKHMGLDCISNYRITGECQDGWTDNPKEAV